MAYAMSLIGWHDDSVWGPIAEEVSKRIAAGQGSQFSDQAITNITWAIMKASHRMKTINEDSRASS